MLISMLGFKLFWAKIGGPEEMNELRKGLEIKGFHSSKGRFMRRKVADVAHLCEYKCLTNKLIVLTKLQMSTAHERVMTH